ncbi:MAG: hypothetical protein Q7T21_00010 [Gallionella sp.]|nr:hypothetical protein [Gallionella sp.]
MRKKLAGQVVSFVAAIQNHRHCEKAFSCERSAAGSDVAIQTPLSKKAFPFHQQPAQHQYPPTLHNHQNPTPDNPHIQHQQPKRRALQVLIDILILVHRIATPEQSFLPHADRLYAFSHPMPQQCVSLPPLATNFRLLFFGDTVDNGI